ncbi:hypothetical protein Golob_006225, partial [Gossypium lobatum]|nr:hypothetical protein [Gossypium lobatum]
MQVAQFVDMNSMMYFILLEINQHNFVMGNFVWSCFFGIVTWCIWKNKNTCIFQGFPWSAEEIIKGAYSWAEQFIYARKGGERFLRDHNGNWILGFNCRLESCSVFEVELWDILDGVALVQGMQHDRILSVENWSIEHVPREKNVEADCIVELAFDRG